MWKSPPVYVMYTFYAIMILIEIVIVSDMWSSNHYVMTCWCFLQAPSPPQMYSFNNIVTGVFSWYTLIHLAYNIKMGTCHVPLPGIMNQSKQNTLIIKNFLYQTIIWRNSTKSSKFIKKIGSIYVFCAKSNTFLLDMNMLYDE